MFETRKRLRRPWWNLRWAAYLHREHLFFASKSGRLTPESGDVRCLYLAQNRETSFYELYGDDLDAAAKAGRRMSFTRRTLEHRVLVKTSGDLSVQLYDLTAERGAQAIGLDLATLYAADLGHPRRFAQRLHDHPQQFDGILYESRHTQSDCIVLWETYSPALRALASAPSASLFDLATYSESTPPGSLRIFDTIVDVATDPVAA